MGSDKDPEPVTGLTANFSPMPRIAPPPFGKAIAGGVAMEEVDAPSFEAFDGASEAMT